MATTKKRSALLSEYIGKIEKDVPLPRIHYRAKYPFADLKVGDSFLTKGIPRDKLRAAIASHRERHGNHLQYVISVDEKTGGLRIHRQMDKD